MRLLRILLVRAAEPDVRPDGDQARPVVVARFVDGRLDRPEVVAVLDPRGVPAVGLEPLRDVLRPRHRCRPVQLDVVVVVQHDQLAQAEMPGERRGLGGDAFLEIAVGRDDIGPVVDDRVAVAVELRGKTSLRDRHADGVGKSLPERPGRGLDARCQARLGMARRPRSPLPERAQLVEWQVVAGQVEQRVQQHRRVPCRQHEPVTVGPVRMRRRVAQEARPQDICHRRRAHRRPGMTGVRRLDAIDRQGPDRVDGESVEVGRHGGHGRDSDRRWPRGAGQVGRPL